jgi:hypothetical protein
MKIQFDAVLPKFNYTAIPQPKWNLEVIRRLFLRVFRVRVKVIVGNDYTMIMGFAVDVHIPERTSLRVIQES